VKVGRDVQSAAILLDRRLAMMSSLDDVTRRRAGADDEETARMLRELAEDAGVDEPTMLRMIINSGLGMRES
jgi:hypothetical protein